MDLIFSAGWEYYLYGEYSVDESLPPLAVIPEPEPARSTSQPSAVVYPPVSTESTDGKNRMFPGVIVSVALAMIAVIAVSVTLLRKR